MDRKPDCGAIDERLTIGDADSAQQRTVPLISMPSPYIDDSRESDPFVTVQADRLIARLGWVLAGIFALLVLLHVARVYLPNIDSGELQLMFDLDGEGNLPAWCSSILFFLVSALAMACYWKDRCIQSTPGQQCGWLWVASAFLFASLDESARIHESLRVVWHYLLSKGLVPNLGERVFMAWFLVYLPFMALFGFLALRFLWRKFKPLPKYRLFLLCSLTCYALAIGLEALVHAFYSELVGFKFLFETRLIIEELGENLGTTFCLLALVAYLCSAPAGYAFGTPRKVQGGSKP